jgi:hypothetical protein
MSGLPDRPLASVSGPDTSLPHIPFTYRYDRVPLLCMVKAAVCCPVTRCKYVCVSFRLTHASAIFQ